MLSSFRAAVGCACVTTTLLALPSAYLWRSLEIRFFPTASCNSSAGLQLIASNKVSLMASKRIALELVCSKVGVADRWVFWLLRFTAHFGDESESKMNNGKNLPFQSSWPGDQCRQRNARTKCVRRGCLYSRANRTRTLAFVIPLGYVELGCFFTAQSRGYRFVCAFPISSVFVFCGFLYLHSQL